jgi:hypothetical protein
VASCDRPPGCDQMQPLITNQTCCSSSVCAAL